MMRGPLAGMRLVLRGPLAGMRLVVAAIMTVGGGAGAGAAAAKGVPRGAAAAIGITLASPVANAPPVGAPPLGRESEVIREEIIVANAARRLELGNLITKLPQPRTAAWACMHTMRVGRRGV